MYIIANIITKYWPRAEEILMAILLVEVNFLFDSFNHTIREAVFNAYEKTEYRLYSITIEKSFSLVLGSFALIAGYGLNGLLIALVFAKLITTIVNYIIMYKRFFKVSLSIDFGLWLDLIKNSLPFGFAIIFRRMYYRIDTVMLSGMKGYAATGLYNAASTIIFALTFIPLVIVNATFPAMSRFYHTNSKDVLRLLYEKSLYYIISIGIPISIGITLLSQRIILFIYKESFIKSSIILQILSWSLLFLFMTQVIGYLLNSINKQHLFTISVGICAMSNAIMNFILIPKFSYIGASIATLITQFLNFCLLYRFTTKSGYPTNLIRISYKPITAGILMGFLIVYLKFLPITYIIPIATVVYFMLLFLIKGIGKEEINLMKSLLPKKS